MLKTFGRLPVLMVWLGVGVVGTVALVYLANLAWNQVQNDMLPPIARNLPGVFSEGNIEFNRRVENLFPIGSSETGLVSELTSQGFKRRHDDDNGGQILHSFSIENTNFPCETIWRVSWRAANGNVSERFGVYGAICP